MCPCPTLSSAPLPPPSHGWGQDGSLFLLLYGSFTTSRRLIPTLSRPWACPTLIDLIPHETTCPVVAPGRGPRASGGHRQPFRNDLSRHVRRAAHLWADRRQLRLRLCLRAGG